MYRWHRVLGLITGLPGLRWTLSGISYPLTSDWLRPPIAHETVPAPSLQAAALALPVSELLARPPCPGTWTLC